MIGRRIFGNYTITALLGEGGMGAVYRASHDSLGLHVAVKVLLPALVAHESIVARFMAEARAASSIKHPNIVKVLDMGTFADSGQHYIVLEFLEGYPLDRAELPLPLDAILSDPGAGVRRPRSGPRTRHRSSRPQASQLVRNSPARLALLHQDPRLRHREADGNSGQSSGPYQHAPRDGNSGIICRRSRRGVPPTSRP